MAESYSVKAILSAVDKNFTSTFKKAESVADTLGGKLKSGLGFGVLAGIGQQAFSKITQGISGMVGELNSSGKAWKTFEGNMNILGKGSSEIQAAKKEMQDYATQTIYSASEMASTYAQLESVGTKNTRKLVKGFGGLAAAAENPKQAMKTLSVQATQMAARPTVAWQDFKLMLEQTPAGMAAVAKEMGRTSEQLVSDIQDGKISTEEFFAAIEKVGNSKGFQELATQYKSLDEAMDGLQETLAVKLTPAFDAISKIGIDSIQGLITKIESINFDKLADNVTSTFNKVQSVVKKTWKAFEETGAVDSAVKAFNSFKEAVSNVVNAVIECGVIEDLAGFFGTLVDQVSIAVTFVTDFIASLDPGWIEATARAVSALVIAYQGMKVISTVNEKLKIFSATIKGLFKKTGSKSPLEDSLKQMDLTNATAEIEAKWRGVAQVIESVGTSMKTTFQGVASSVRSLGTAVSTAAQGIGTGLATAFTGLGTAIAMVPPTTWLALSTAILAVGAAFALVGSQGEGFKAILQGVSLVISSLLPVVQTVVNGIVASIASLGTSIATVVTSVSDGMATITLAIGEAISGVLNSLSNIIDSIGNAALNAGKGFDNLANGIVKITELNLFDMGASLGAVAAGLVAIGASSIGVNSTANGLTKLTTAMTKVQNATSTVGNSFKSMISTASSALSALTSSVTRTSSQVQNAFKTMGAKANSGFKSGLSKLPSTANSILHSVISTLNSGKSQAYQSGSYISQGFAQGMLSQLALVTSAANRLVAQADRAIRAKARIHSPSKLTDKLGSYFGEGFGNGIYNMTGYVQRATNELFSIPQMSASDMTLTYTRELSDDFEYYHNAMYTVVVPVELDGREIAKVTAPYTEDELNKRSRHDSRKHGRI